MILLIAPRNKFNETVLKVIHRLSQQSRVSAVIQTDFQPTSSMRNLPPVTDSAKPEMMAFNLKLLKTQLVNELEKPLNRL